MTGDTTVSVADNGSIAGPELTIASDITGGSTTDIIKTGDGTLLLTDTNNAADAGINRLRVYGGILQFEDDSNLSDSHTRISTGNTAAVLEYVGPGGASYTLVNSGGL